MNYSINGSRRVRTNTGLSLTIIIGVILLGTAPLAASPPSKLQLRLGYKALGESNIYHAHLDSQEVADQTNALAGILSWEVRQTSLLTHTAEIYGDADLYMKHSNRNKTSYGFRYSPELRYGRIGRIAVTVDISRRDKDLLNDAGEVLPQTLKKNIITLEAANRNKVGQLRIDQAFTFNRYNYDDVYMNGVRQRSYSYDKEIWQFRVGYELWGRLEARAAFETEKRFYDQRLTLSLDKLSSHTRNFRENTFDLQLAYRFLKNNWIAFETAYGRRSDNYQNFYGFDVREHTVAMTFKPNRRLNTELSFGYRTKDYPNYYTGNIGQLHRVSIDYATFKVQQEFRLTQRQTLMLYLRNFNKVSNDPSFDYHDLSAGVGVEVKI